MLDSSTRMSPASTPQGSAYLTALTQEIERKLQRAIASPSQRRNLLQELFADIALEIDDRARDIILNGTEDVISPADDVTASKLCFFDVLADHYVLAPENGKLILDLIVKLWSQSFASHIFSLLFHKWESCPWDPHVDALPKVISLVPGYSRLFHKIFTWISQLIKLFEVQLESDDILLRYAFALVQGATNVFWIDIQTNTRHFQSLFCFLLEEVALVPTRLNKIPLQAQKDLFLLLSRFIVFYNSGDRVESFLKQFPVFPISFLLGGAADIFVIELADQLQKLKVEPVLLHYLSQIKVLQGLELRMTTSTRLKSCLYSFTSPGGPMYPTRAVRHAAWDSLDLLFPIGQYPRHLISLFFRLLYPWSPELQWHTE